MQTCPACQGIDLVTCTCEPVTPANALVAYAQDAAHIALVCLSDLNQSLEALQAANRHLHNDVYALASARGEIDAVLKHVVKVALALDWTPAQIEQCAAAERGRMQAADLIA